MKRLALTLLALATFAQAHAQLTIWALDGSEKVPHNQNSHFYESDPLNLVWQDGEVNIFGVRNEIVDFQLVLENNTASNVTNLQVYLPRLVNGTDTIDNRTWVANGSDQYSTAGKYIEIFLAQYRHYTKMKTYSSYWHVDSRPSPEANYIGYMPHGLVPVEADSVTDSTATSTTSNGNTVIRGAPFFVKAGRNQTVWFDIYIPRDATAGMWTGEIVVTSWGDTVGQPIPVNLEIYPVMMSDSTHFKHYQFIGPEAVYREFVDWVDVNASQVSSVALMNIFKKYFQLFHRHRMIPASNRGLPNNSEDFWEYESWVNKFSSAWSGTFFQADSGYGGPGENVGFAGFLMNMYDRPLAYSGSTFPSGPTVTSANPEARLRGKIMGNDAATYQKTMSDLRAWFDANAPNTQLVMQVTEENTNWNYNMDSLIWWVKDGSGNPGFKSPGVTTGDSAVVWPVVRLICGWAKSYNIETMLTGGVHAVVLSNTDNNTANFITMPLVRNNGWTAGEGVNSVILRANNTDGVTWDYASNAANAIGQGDELGLYADGWPAWGDFQRIPNPGWVARVPFLVARRYLDTIKVTLQWETSFQYGAPRGTVNSTPSGWEEQTDPDDSGNMVVPGVLPPKYLASSYWKKFSRGYNGPMASIQMKNIRRGLQDYELFWLADSLGVPEATLQTILQRAVPRAFNDWGTLTGGTPQFMAATYDYDASKGWDTHPFSTRGYYYEAMRRELCDTINGRLGAPSTPKPSGTFTASTSTVDAPGDSVGFNWSVQNADSIAISVGKDGSAGWRALTYAATGVESIWVAQNTTVEFHMVSPDDQVTSKSASVTYNDAEVELTELITDGGFESNDVGVVWEDNPDAQISRSTGTPKTGSYRLQWDVNNPLGAWEQVYMKTPTYVFPIVNGQEYNVRVKLYGSSASTIRCDILTIAYAAVGFSNKKINFGNSAWTTWDSVFTATATGDCYIRFAASGTSPTVYATAGMTIYIDSISVTPYSPAASLSATTVTFPVDGATNVDTSISVTWTSVENATGYKVDLDTQSDFSTVSTTDAGNVLSLAYGDLNNEQLYYLRVYPYTPYGNGPYSDTISFTTRALSTGPSTQVTVVYINLNKTGLSVDTASVAWNGVSGITQYQVQFLTDTTAADDSLAFLVSDTSFVLGRDGPAPPLQYRQWYYWRIRAYNSAGTGPWSEWKYFKTAAEQALRPKRSL